MTQYFIVTLVLKPEENVHFGFLWNVQCVDYNGCWFKKAIFNMNWIYFHALFYNINDAQLYLKCEFCSSCVFNKFLNKSSTAVKQVNSCGK